VKNVIVAAGDTKRVRRYQQYEAKKKNWNFGLKILSNAARDFHVTGFRISNFRRLQAFLIP
jgi:hypothetical protein